MIICEEEELLLLLLVVVVHDSAVGLGGHIADASEMTFTSLLSSTLLLLLSL